jgi:hypothetical protein
MMRKEAGFLEKQRYGLRVSISEGFLEKVSIDHWQIHHDAKELEHRRRRAEWSNDFSLRRLRFIGRGS